MAQAGSRAASKRTYWSPIREERARITRERILAAARTEFLRSGYAATTIRAVAARAGVSVATVELVFGTKPALLQAAISFSIRGDADPTPMLQRGWVLTAARARSASEFLAIVGRVLVDSAQRSAGLVAAALEAAAQDESLRALSDQLRTQRKATAAWIVDGVLARTPLRPEIDREQAIDTVWLLMDPRVFSAATHDRGWIPERFAQWFSDGMGRLLTPEARAAATPRPPSRLAIVCRHASANTQEEEIMSDDHKQPQAGGRDHSVDADLATPGAITYLHIPAADVRQAAAFYRDVFDWTIRDADSDRPSFDDPSGHLSGAWVTDHLAATQPGLLPYIYVDHVEETLRRILAHGGEIVTDPFPEGRLTVASVRDPAGNVLGLWHDTTRVRPDSSQHPDATARMPILDSHARTR